MVSRYCLETGSLSRERDQVRWPQAEQRTTVHVVRVSIAGVVRYIGRLEADVLGQILIGVHLVMPGKFRIRYNRTSDKGSSK